MNAKRVQRSIYMSTVAGGAEGPSEATETGQAVAQRRILHPSAAVLAQSRLVL